MPHCSSQPYGDLYPANQCITLSTQYCIIEQRKSSWRCVSSRGVSMSVKGEMGMERNANRKDPSSHRFVKPQTQLSRTDCSANIIKRNRIFWRVVETHGKMNTTRTDFNRRKLYAWRWMKNSKFRCKRRKDWAERHRADADTEKTQHWQLLTLFLELEM